MDNKGNKTNTQTNTSTTPSTATTSGTNNTVFSPIPLKLVTESDHSQTKNQTTRKTLNEWHCFERKTKMADKKTDTKPQNDTTKENNTVENNVFSPIPLKLSTYTDHSSENAEKRGNTSDED